MLAHLLLKPESNEQRQRGGDDVRNTAAIASLDETNWWVFTKLECDEVIARPITGNREPALSGP